MSDPRAIDGDFDSATGSSAEKADTDADSSSTGDVLKEAAEASRRAAPAGLAGSIAQATGDMGSAEAGRGGAEGAGTTTNVAFDSAGNATTTETLSYGKDENVASAGLATGKDPSTSPTSGLSGLATGKDPSTSPTSGLSGLATGKDPSIISGSEDDDLEDLEVQRRTVRGGDEFFGSWSATDQPEIAGSSATAMKGDATAPTAGVSAGKDPSTISGSEDDDLEDLEVQRRTVRGGASEATTGSAIDEGIIVVDTGLQDPRTVGLAGSAIDEGIIVVDTGLQDPRTVGLAGSAIAPDAGGAKAPAVQQVVSRGDAPGVNPYAMGDFTASIMGGLAAPAEMSATLEAPALSMDLAAGAPAVAEAGLPPTELDEMKTWSVAGDDATAGDFDLSAQGAAFEFAPVAIEAHKDQPVLEQLDPGLSAEEPPPDASDIGQMDVPLP